MEELQSDFLKIVVRRRTDDLMESRTLRMRWAVMAKLEKEIGEEKATGNTKGISGQGSAGFRRELNYHEEAPKKES
jgi:hypothetical protein